MSEKIKFRVWNKNLKCFIPYPRCASGIPNNWNINSIFEDESVVFQQFTGLKDKNGKEIYEGDFIKDFEFPVEFMDGCFGPRIAYDITFCPLWELKIETLEVIGNIFETPELLLNV